MAGLAASGVDVVRLGVIPTPGVAHLTAALNADFGVMLSASHNPAPDNGIKFFARGGVKLPDEVEAEIEARLIRPDQPVSFGPAGVPAGGFGRVSEAAGQGHRYTDYLLSTVTGPAGTGKPLAGLRVVVDCAHGAAAAYAPELLREAGAEVIAIGAEPDGLNINEGCGSTSLGTLSAAVAELQADAGIAHDGDADRCLAVDAAGQVVDGDQILAVLAVALKEEGRLARRYRRRHRDVQSGLPARDGRGRDQHRADPGRRPVPDRRHAGRRLCPRRRAVGAHHHARARHHRRRHADRPAPARRNGPSGAPAG